MPNLTSSHRVCSPRAIMESHAKHRLTVCDVQRPWCHATPDVVQLCVLYKNHDGMPLLTSSDCVCFPKAMMACHVWGHQPCVLSMAMITCHVKHRSTMSALQVLWCHAKHDTVPLCVLSKVYTGMPRPISFYHVCCRKEMTACYARRCPTMCPVHER